MNQFRSGLTRLKHLIQEKLPEDGDIYGYPGITKASLLTAINGIYLLSQEIPDDSRFEITSLKRAGSELYRRLKEFLESTANQDEQKVGFNSFLDSLALLVEKTRMAYFIIAKNGIRDEEELAQIRQTAGELLQSTDDLKEKHNTVAEKLSAIIAASEEIAERHDASEKQSLSIKEAFDKASQSSVKIEQLRAASESASEEIGSHEDNLKSLSNKIEKLAAESTVTKDRLDKILKDSETAAKGLGNSTTQHAELLAKINLALEDANRIGMASSFKARKDELRFQQGSWQLVFVAALTFIVGLVWKIVLPTVTDIQSEAANWTRLVGELGLVTPLVWLGWFAARQYGYTTRIREDYAFKSAAAMAYEGHKKAARETDKNLESTLLEFSLYNMSQNPIRLYGDKDVHGSPVHEAASHFIDRLTRFKKIMAESPQLGRVEVIAGDDEKSAKKDA